MKSDFDLAPSSAMRENNTIFSLKDVCAIIGMFGWLIQNPVRCLLAFISITVREMWTILINLIYYEIMICKTVQNKLFKLY